MPSKPLKPLVLGGLALLLAVAALSQAHAQDSPPSLKQDTPPAPAQTQETTREALRLVPDHQAGFKTEDPALPSSGPKAADAPAETVVPKNVKPGEDAGTDAGK